MENTEKIVVLACEMLSQEIRAAMAEAGLDCETIWVERALHDYPDRLRAELQSRIDLIQADTILMAFAQCGNAPVGLEARGAQLVLPRFADCLHLFRSFQPGDPGQVDPRTLYASPGFLEERGGLLRDYDRCLARYGEKKALRMCRALVRNYRYITYLDTGTADPAAFEPLVRQRAEILDLEPTACEGTTRVLRKLFSGPWDDEFVIVPPGGRLDMSVFLSGPPAVQPF